MRQLVLTVFLASATVLPANAQEDSGSSLMEEGAQQFLEGLLKELQPAWEEMQAFMDEMGPAMLELMDEVRDWSAYEPPEMLENGDIIIRRKPEAPEKNPTPDVEKPGGAVEL